MSTSLDEDILILEDLDFDPTCEAKDGCPSAQTWLWLRFCCGNEMGLCDEHHGKTILFLQRHSRFRCDLCGFVWSKNEKDNFKWTKL